MAPAGQATTLTARSSYLRPAGSATSQESQRARPVSPPPATLQALGLPPPNSFRISSPRLCAATCTTYRLLTLTNPRSQVRRPPPVSHTWAKLRSTNSLRLFCKRLLLAPRVRRRLACV